MGRKPTKFYPYQGRMYTCTELAEMAGVEYQIMYHRFTIDGMTPEEAVERGDVDRHCTHPRLRKYTLDGKKMSMNEISEALYVRKETFWNRARKNGTAVQEEIDKEARKQGRCS